MMDVIKIKTPRFYLKELNDADVTKRYVNWFFDQEIKKHICFASQAVNLNGLKEYVKSKRECVDVLFLGIFDKKTGVHIGNIKFEPVDSEKQIAVLGIMIGEIDYRGIGAASEVINSSVNWLKENRNIRKVELGVAKSNKFAIKSYEKAGFFIDHEENGNVKMIKELD